MPAEVAVGFDAFRRYHAELAGRAGDDVVGHARGREEIHERWLPAPLLLAGRVRAKRYSKEGLVTHFSAVLIKAPLGEQLFRERGERGAAFHYHNRGKQGRRLLSPSVAVFSAEPRMYER
jgi:hypothetical protein